MYLPEEEIRRFATRLQNAQFLNVDFEKVMNMAGAGDFLYCDPPYAPLSPTANFTAYASGSFSEEQQKRIALLAEAAQARGAVVLVSNHDTAFTRELYKNASRIDGLEVSRSISAKGDSRKKAQEIFALYA